jgi:uncharacterized membrane protein YraQ (UPF0718 family)
MFLLNFIPDAFLALVVNAVLIAGLVGTVASILFKLVIRYIPWFIPYRTILQAVSVLLLVAGVYFKGGIGVEMEWRAKVKDLEEKIAKSEAESKAANQNIVTVYKDRVKVVKEQQVVIQEKIKEVEVKIDSQCTITPETIDILNNSAKGPQK